ncbi:MAG: hypothetical protein K8T10_06740 [Candidatus Eremiobacteraeota bacterium]|nr:hypothetical protein [Candidatus Eremiobacteraeota bacterium]
MKTDRSIIKRTQKGSSLKIICVLLLFFFLFSSCGDKKKSIQEKFSKKIDLKFKVPIDKVIKYNLRMSGKGGVFFKNPDPGKTKHHPEDIMEDYVLSFKGMENGRIDLIWKYFQYNPDTGEKIPGKMVSFMADDRLRTEGVDPGNFGILLKILFPIPDKPVPVNQIWKKDLGTTGNEKGFIRSSIIGFETLGEQKCVKIKSEFDFLSEKESDFFRIEGDGIAYYSIRKNCFIDSNYKYSMRSKFLDKTTGEELRIELLGSIEASLVK